MTAAAAADRHTDGDARTAHCRRQNTNSDGDGHADAYFDGYAVAADRHGDKNNPDGDGHADAYFDAPLHADSAGTLGLPCRRP